MSSSVETVAQLIREAEGSIVVLSGSGLSEDSGIPTFRGGGPDAPDPLTFGRKSGIASALLFDFPRTRRFMVSIGRTFLGAEPNPGHHALAALERAGKLDAVITQNVDELHRAAGSREVFDLHGSYFRSRCGRCRRAWPVTHDELRDLMDALDEANGRRGFVRAYQECAPRCDRCGKLGRPDMVLFGEGLPANKYQAAEDHAAECKVMLVVGTSVLVRPANDLPYIAHHAGAALVEINPEPTQISELADHCVRGRSSEALQAIADAVIDGS